MKKMSYLLVICVCFVGMTGCGKNADSGTSGGTNANVKQKCSESYNCVENADGNYDCLYTKYYRDRGYDFDNEEKIVCSEDQINISNQVRMHD